MSATTAAPTARTSEAAGSELEPSWAEPVAPMTYRKGRVTRLTERGMVTAEYAIGILCAIAIALTVAKFMTGNEGINKFTKLITQYIGQIGGSIKIGK